MKPMGDPDFVYQPWTPERRRAASIAAKKRSLAKIKARGLKSMLETIRQQAFGAGYEEGLRFANDVLHKRLYGRGGHPSKRGRRKSRR